MDSGIRNNSNYSVQKAYGFLCGKRLIEVFWDTQGCRTPKSKLCAKANFVYL